MMTNLENEDGKQKVKEKGVEFNFLLESGNRYSVSAEGENEFGSFSLVGSFDSVSRELICTKSYVGAEANGDDDDDDDDELDGEIDVNEAADLAAEAEMSIEELRAKYYGGASTDSNDEPATKKRKL